MTTNNIVNPLLKVIEEWVFNITDKLQELGIEQDSIKISKRTYV